MGSLGGVGALHCADVELATTGADGKLEASHVGWYGIGDAHLEHTYYTLHDDVQRESVTGAECGVSHEGLLNDVAGEADYSAVAPEVRPYDMDNEYDRVMEAAETVNE